MHTFAKWFTKRQTTNDLEEIMKSLRKTPGGIAAVVNPDYQEPPYLYVLDVELDTPEVRQVVEKIALETPVVKTRRGWHIWFRCTERLHNVMFEGEFDLLAERHLAHLPPSVRYVGQGADGKKEYMIYEFHPSCAHRPRDPSTLRVEPAEISVKKVEELIKNLTGREITLGGGGLIVRKEEGSRRIARESEFRFGHAGWVSDFQELVSIFEKMRGSLPRCVEWAFFEKHKTGSRWIAGHIIVLTALHLLNEPSKNVDALDKFLSDRLEGYPQDDGGSLRDKLLGRLYLRNENWLPAYSAPITVPENLCRECPHNWFMLCRKGVVARGASDLRNGLLGNTKKIFFYLPFILYAFSRSEDI